MIVHRNDCVHNAEAQRRRGAEIFDERLSWDLDGTGLRRGEGRSGRSDQRKGAKAQRRNIATMGHRTSSVDSCESPRRGTAPGDGLLVVVRGYSAKGYSGAPTLLSQSLRWLCAFAPLRLCVQLPTGHEASPTPVERGKRVETAAMAFMCDGSASLRLCASALIPRCASALSLPVRA